MATRIAISRCRVREREMWRVRYWESGKPKRRFFHSKNEAEAERARLKTQVDSFGAVWFSMTSAEREHLISAHNEAKARGVDIRKAVSTAQNGHCPSLVAVIDELQKSKLSNGRDKEYVRNAACIWKQFARGIESLPANLVTLAHLERFLESKGLRYRQTVRGRLSAIFSFCVRRGYRLDNPCDRLEFAKITRATPHILNVQEFRKAVTWMAQNNPRGLAWFALTAACGLRPDEARKTTLADLNLKEGYIKVEAQTTKTRMRRVVYPKSEAIELLKWSVSKGGMLPLSKNSLRAVIAGRNNRNGGLRTALGFKIWPKDITRHTAASYWLAGSSSVAQVAEMLGHSEGTLKRHYKALVTREEAVRFWQAVKSMPQSARGNGADDDHSKARDGRPGCRSRRL